MQTTFFYVIEPTATLRELSVAAGQEYVAQRAVWHVRQHDRVGAQYSKAEISRAHWMQFIANLIGENDEPPTLVELREKCLSLGFEGCWTICEAKVGGDAKDLMDEAQAAQAFLRGRGIEMP
jgi:hypothetical protein